VEVYESEANEIVRRFLAHKLSFPQCIAGLDAALAGLIPRLTAVPLDYPTKKILATSGFRDQNF